MLSVDPNEVMGIKERLLSQNAERFEFSILNFNQEKKILTGSLSPVSNVENEIIGYILVASDITEREEIRSHMEQQEKLAVLGQMAAGIVHEIKNPLTTIKGFNQIILKKTKEASTREYADIIEDEVNQVNTVVTDFLAFARPRKPSLKEISINELFKSIEIMIETQLFIKRILFELKLPSVEHTVLVDDSQIKQVIINIIKNAIDALETVENPKLNINVNFLKNNGEMKISIKDNGRGISAQDIMKLGTPFFTTKEKGTGLGLSICYQIIKENNGIITCESKLNEGTTFNIVLPCTERCQLGTDTLPLDNYFNIHCFSASTTSS